jgi:hypothetical protein
MITTKHLGFKTVQEKIAKKQGVSREQAGSILAAAGRKAGIKALQKNPRLKKISSVGK